MTDVPDRMRIACSWCGSTNVSRDAWASWDVERQAWALGAVFDDGFCHACERARGLEEVGSTDDSDGASSVDSHYVTT